MTATISELIIAAAVDPQGIKQGLDRGAGYLRQFGKTAEQDLNEAFNSFNTSAPERAGIEAGRALLGGLTNQFKNVQTVLTSSWRAASSRASSSPAPGSRLRRPSISRS
jgi:hypothetical protein